MFETFKKKFKELKWRLKKYRKPSLLDLNYSTTEDPLGRPFATPERIEEYIKLGADINEHLWDKKTGRSLFPFGMADASGNHAALACLFRNGGADNISDDWLDSIIEDPENKAIKKELLAFQKKRMKDALLKLDYHTATKADIDRLIKKGADVNAWVATRNSVGEIEKEKTPI